MAGFETLDVDRFILGLRQHAPLQALFPAGRVVMSADFAASEPPPFYLVFAMMSEHDTNTMDGNRVFSSPSYLIQWIGREIGFDVGRPIMEVVDAFVTARETSRVVGTTYVSRFMRTNVVKEARNLDNVRWFYLGGVYDTVCFTV